jgi:hypothetical protein
MGKEVRFILREKSHAYKVHAAVSKISKFMVKRRHPMKRLMKTVLGIGSAAILMASAVYAGPTSDPGIQQREQNQQQRIDQGVTSGQITPGEAGRLERQQARIQQNETRMKSDGKLTKQERRKLTREQDRASRNIYRKKHNNRKANVSSNQHS